MYGSCSRRITSHHDPSLHNFHSSKRPDVSGPNKADSLDHVICTAMPVLMRLRNEPMEAIFLSDLRDDWGHGRRPSTAAVEDPEKNPFILLQSSDHSTTAGNNGSQAKTLLRELPQPQVHERSQLYRSRLRPFLEIVPEPGSGSELGLLRCRCRQLRGHLVVHAGDAEAAMRHVPHLHDRVGERGDGKAWSVSVRTPTITETALTSIRDATVRAPNDVVVLTMLSFAPLQHQVQESRRNNYQFQGTTARGGGASPTFSERGKGEREKTGTHTGAGA